MTPERHDEWMTGRFSIVVLNPAIEKDRRAIMLYAAIIERDEPERARELREKAGNGVKRESP